MGKNCKKKVDGPDRGPTVFSAGPRYLVLDRTGTGTDLTELWTGPGPDRPPLALDRARTGTDPTEPWTGPGPGPTSKILDRRIYTKYVRSVAEDGPDINYNPKWTIILNLPTVSEIKINSILTVAIAFDRFSAFAWPVAYKLRRRGYYTLASAAVAITWGVTDASFCYFTAPFVPKTGCGAAGCFMNETFRYYWGVSDMFINAIVMVITALVLANQITVSVLLCSGICIFLPSTLGGLGELFGLSAFASLGPFVAVGLQACGVGNAFIFIFQHTVIRNSIYEIGKRLRTNVTTL
uniref:G-protein coupled receptors family 1 profile domain-containing protein n=1 Tax=Plectus sambesii TaxID=2011161 RepID=A0A914VJB8_9BILA